MAAENENENLPRGYLVVFPLSTPKQNSQPFTIEVKSERGEISFWRCNCGCNCKTLMPPTKNNCSRCGCPRRRPPQKGGWVCDCGCGCGVSMPQTSSTCSSCGCNRRFPDPIPEEKWRCNCGCGCGITMDKKVVNCGGCGCPRMCEKCMISPLSQDGSCKNCLKNSSDKLPPSLLFSLKEDGHLTLIQEDEEECGATGKEGRLKEMNDKMREVRDRLESVEGELREAQGCSTGQDFALIGKLFMEKQKIEGELKNLTCIKEITFDRRIAGCTYDLPPGITTFVGATTLECCLTWCPRVGKVQETGTVVNTAVPVYIENGVFKIK